MFSKNRAILSVFYGFLEKDNPKTIKSNRYLIIEEFVSEGGIRERMTAARLGYRNNQREAIESTRHEIESLKEENQHLKTYILQQMNEMKNRI